MEKLLPDIAANSTGSAVAAEHYRPYPAYRDSGVEWLGEIPAHWDVKRLKEFATVQLGNVDKKTADDEDDVQLCNYVDVYYNHKIEREIEFMSATATLGQIGRFSLRKGDVLITKDSETWTDIAVPAVVMEDLPGVLCGYYLAHIRPHEQHDGFFLAHCIAAVGPRDQYHIAANGITRFGLTGNAIRNGIFAIPPPAEQRHIAAFLDLETEKIDALVAKKERLIELLHEKRTALVTYAVTKGIEPDAPMKDSGVEWLGEIPVNWGVAPIYARYEVALGKMLDAKRISGNSLGRYLRSVDVQWNSVNTRDLPTMDFSPQERDRYSLQLGDVLVCEGGEVGRTAMWPGSDEECFYQKAIHRVRPISKCDIPRFFFYLMCALAAKGVFLAEGNPNTINHLTATQLRHYRVAFPPQHEQRAVAAHLDRETTKIDALVAKVRDAIDRLKEFRIALISAAMTGKIDVREFVP